MSLVKKNLNTRDLLEGPRLGWDHNIKMDIGQIGCDYMEWI